MISAQFVQPVTQVEKKYYVYELAYPDGKPFYYGKGTLRRMDDHERDARKGKKSKPCDVIRAIVANGWQVQKRKVFESDDEQMCQMYELALIILANANDGLANVYACHGNRHKVQDVEPVEIIVEPIVKSEQVRSTMKYPALEPEEVAKILRLNPQTVKRLANRGELPGFKIGGRWRFRREAIDEHIKKLEQQSDQDSKM